MAACHIHKEPRHVIAVESTARGGWEDVTSSGMPRGSWLLKVCTLGFLGGPKMALPLLHRVGDCNSNTSQRGSAPGPPPVYRTRSQKVTFLLSLFLLLLPEPIILLASRHATTYLLSWRETPGSQTCLGSCCDAELLPSVLGLKYQSWKNPSPSLYCCTRNRLPHRHAARGSRPRTMWGYPHRKGRFPSSLLAFLICLE